MMIGLLQRGWKQISSKNFCSLNHKPLHVCVVGSGPAGFYTAEKMLKAQERAQVDILDRLPTPFGLVRSGVAPDHPETKIVINQFSRVASNERCSFFGNVSLGSDVNLPELRDIYDVVVVAYGAESDRSLGVPGEDLMGIHSAREFVWWYNGHPDYHNMTPDLKSTDTAVVLGQGNVALDVARILLRSTSELQKTDIAEHALVSLHESTIRKVYLVGRRGPAQMACTAKELREILGVKDLRVHIDEPDLVISPAEEEELKSSRIHRRVYDLLCKSATSHQQRDLVAQRELNFKFFRKPFRFLPSEDPLRVGGVCLEKTCLKENGLSGKQVAVGTGEFEELGCGLVLKSIGYKSLPVNGLPFDDYKGVVPNVKGRVLSGNQEEQANLEKGLYVVGWLKRGPTGIIGTNLYCAEETVASILEDLNNGLIASATTPKPGRKCLLQVLESKNVKYVTFSGWEKIDAKEKFEGELRNKPREKLTAWDELLKVAHHEH
ncbi:NADPH:adrenodoxin oxidoreductase, mitochondrial-like isoform X1 [Zingiber officinale]|uniref:NADPH:adrenodoxin oxidoreductase, mitochondrial-like isoform X1 n=1 Tax=Zingiber officinale TaxID=94328 RepID=UPI001C4AA1B7|nr:NADPH:adrenodoxin oxidoreductase, mitochondrial-like isoform X1 [Zingiber officinale]XP_042456758.1 NADPH:adrenodoxin oxidoreductase, mitochondrial-like isoform X1 [Zingiber officinale]XP_042456759.1 NADPH:adrenodoxin oxidoreductase, mitochondrial-like isoform X1 [Zingiber officinale]